MKKSIKNTIMIGMAAVLIGTSAVTYGYINVTSHAGQMPQQGFTQQGDGNSFDGKFDRQLPNGGNSPDFGSGNAQGGSSAPEQNQTPDSGTPQQGQLPDNGTQQQNGSNAQQPPQENGDNAQQPPQENSDGAQQEQDGKSSSNTSTDGAKENTEQLSVETQAENAMPKIRRSNTALNILCYAFLAVQLAILLMDIVYLIISKFNKLSFNQVFPENKAE